MRFWTNCILAFLLLGTANLAVSAQKKAGGKTAEKEPWNKTPQLIKDIRRISVPTASMDKDCLARLKAAKIPYQLYDNVPHVRTPIKPLTDKLGGITYRRAWNNPDAPWIMECKTVENLILAGPKLQKYGIASMYWNSAWRVSYVRGKNQLSRHAYGEALDVTAIDGTFGYATVVGNWHSKSAKGAALRNVISALRDAGFFKTVLNPDFDAYHRDHFHIDSPSRSVALQVKYDVKSLDAPAPQNVELAPDPKSKNETKTPPRSHELTEPPAWPWEPPRSRPKHW